ncbi:MAG: ABC transporter ATP-binding protein [Chlamydiota bacterium]|nr:ABC transporter ATP-binding protein [Chlamydiota bacterium]
MKEDPLLIVDSLSHAFKNQRPVLQSLSFSLMPGEILGLIGGSGCGKTTLAHLILQLLPIQRGSIHFQGRAVSRPTIKSRRKQARHLQAIFQDPVSSLNPRMKVESLIQEPFHIHRLPHSSVDIHKLMSSVHLPTSYLSRYPHQLSGGERQRIAIARSLALKPTLLLCDEPLSSLDYVIQYEILELFRELHTLHNITYLFISHDLQTLAQFATRCLVLHEGQIVDEGTFSSLYTSPKHPYTHSLLNSLPQPTPPPVNA